MKEVIMENIDDLIENSRRIEKLLLTIKYDENIGDYDNQATIARINTLTSNIKEGIIEYIFDRIWSNKDLSDDLYVIFFNYLKNNVSEYLECYEKFLNALIKLMQVDIRENKPHYTEAIIIAYTDILRYIAQENRYDREYFEEEIKSFVSELKKFVSIKSTSDRDLTIWVNNLLFDIKIPFYKHKIFEQVKIRNEEENKKFYDILCIDEDKEQYDFTGASLDPEYSKLLEQANQCNSYSDQADVLEAMGKFASKYKIVPGENHRPISTIAYEILDNWNENLDEKALPFIKMLLYIDSLDDDLDLSIPPITILSNAILHLSDTCNTKKLEDLLFEFQRIFYYYYEK